MSLIEAGEEPAIRSMALRWPTGGETHELFSDEDRLIFAAQGVMQVTTTVGEWVIPPLHAIWIPGGLRHRVAMPGPASLRILYFGSGLWAALPRECRVTKPAPLLRE